MLMHGNYQLSNNPDENLSMVYAQCNLPYSLTNIFWCAMSPKILFVFENIQEVESGQDQ
jgi:hypothetical protein